MIRGPPRSTLDRSSAASDVYKRQVHGDLTAHGTQTLSVGDVHGEVRARQTGGLGLQAVSYTHLRAHETVLDIVCRLLLEKKNHTLPYVSVQI